MGAADFTPLLNEEVITTLDRRYHFAPLRDVLCKSYSSLPCRGVAGISHDVATSDLTKGEGEMKMITNALLIVSVLIPLTLSLAVASQVAVLQPAGMLNQSPHDTLRWRRCADPTVNFCDGFYNPGDSVAVWFRPLAPCRLIAIRFYPYDVEGSCLVDIWDGSHYDGHIVSTDSTDENGWIGNVQYGQWNPGPVLGHSPLGWSGIDPDHHPWGSFPITITRAHHGRWFEIPAAYGIQGEADLGNNPFFVSLVFYPTAGCGMAAEDEGTTPYHSFRYYADGTGPDNEHFGWFIHSASVWYEAIVEYYEPVPRPLVEYVGCSIDDDESGESMGNGDGVVNAGEAIELTIQLVNSGDTPATDVNAVLRTLDEYVSVTDSLEAFGDIAPGDTVHSVGDFDFAVPPDYPSGNAIEFSLEIGTAGGESLNTATFSIEVYRPATDVLTIEIQPDRDDPVSKDAWMYEYSPSFNYGSGTVTHPTASLYLKYQRHGMGHILIKFDVAGNLPPEAVVEGARLKLYKSSDNGPGKTKSVKAYKLLQDWGEGSRWDLQATTGESCWNYAKYGLVPWAVGGADGAGTDRSATAEGDAVTVTHSHGWHTWSLSASTVQGWLTDPGSNHGLLLKPEGGSHDDFYTFWRSREFGDEMLRPKLIIEYTLFQCHPPNLVRPTDFFGQIGDVIHTDITVYENLNPIEAFGLHLTFDERSLAFDTVTACELTEDAIVVSGTQIGPGLINIGGFSTIPIEPGATGCIARVFFSVIAHEPGDSIRICTQNLIDDLAEWTWPCCGSFIFCTCGDVDCSREITPKDALHTFWRSLLGHWEVECECSDRSADVNCDGEITPADALCTFWRFIYGDWTAECSMACQCSSVARASRHAAAVKELILPSVSGLPGDVVRVPVLAKNPQGLDAFRMDLTFPEHLLEFQNVRASQCTRDWIALEGVLTHPGVVTIGGFHSDALYADGSPSVVEVVFAVRDGASGQGYFDVVHLTDDVQGARVEKGNIAVQGGPRAHALFGNYPNPFNPATSIRYSVASDESPPHVTLRIFNLLGQEVAMLVDEVQESGYYAVTWDGSDMASGVYFYRLTAGEFTDTKRMVLMK